MSFPKDSTISAILSLLLLLLCLLSRLTRTPGGTTAAKAIAPQARTERTVEKRILNEGLEMELEKL